MEKDNTIIKKNISIDREREARWGERKEER